MNVQDQKKAILDGLFALFRPNGRWLVFFGTGTSVDLDNRLGMAKLADHLRKRMPSDAAGWPEVCCRLRRNLGLEQALTDSGLPKETKRSIERLTGEFVAACDLRLRNDILLGRKNWVGESLLRNLVQRLPPSKPRLSVVTSNYDMLIEYACAKNRIRYTTGYTGEIRRTWNWNQALDSLTQVKTAQRRGKTTRNRELIPRVELHKVHGSINLFRNADGGEVVECDTWAAKPPDGFTRVIAVPGDQKFQAVAENPDSGYTACEAEDQAIAFLMVGYGFNDQHLDARIRNRVGRFGCPLVVLTRELPDATIGNLRRAGTQTWVLTSATRQGRGTVGDRTRVACPLFDGQTILEGERLWSCDSFAQAILGG